MFGSESCDVRRAPQVSRRVQIKGLRLELGASILLSGARGEEAGGQGLLLSKSER